MIDFAPESQQWESPEARVAFRRDYAQTLVESGVRLTLTEWMALDPLCQEAIADAAKADRCAMLVALAAIVAGPKAALPELAADVDDASVDALIDADIAGEAARMAATLFRGGR